MHHTFHHVTPDPHKGNLKMALNVVKLMNSKETDRDQINSLLVQYLLEDGSNRSDTD